MTAARFTGTSVRRVEDPRLLTGRGRYVDDLRLPGTLHAAFVRSPLAHGRLLGVDVAAARALPGVHAVLTDADLRRHIGDLVAAAAPELFAPGHSALARDTVRLVGEPIAIVVADSRHLAEDACALVEVELDPLPAVADMDRAMEPDAPLLFPEHGSNVTFRSEHRYGDTGAAFARAAHVVRERFFQHRHANVPMEGRAGLAEWSTAGELTYHASHQAPHALRQHLANLLRIPVDLVRVRCGDIGGAFGQKAGVGREDVAVCATSRLLGRPVKWIEDRAENLTVGGQAREERMDVEAAFDADGALLGLRVRLVLDGGAYPQVGFPVSGYTNIMRALMPGAYRLEHYDFEAVAVTTNKATYVPYRGPWEVETWVRERLLDVIARVTGLDPVEVRLRNLWRDDELPRASVTGAELIGISQRESLRLACERIGYGELRAEQETARTQGRFLGVGVANFIEPAPVMPSLLRAMGFEAAPRTVQEARLRLEPDGSVTVFTSQQPHGQGHQTTLAQLVADGVGVPFERVRVVHGDTEVTPFNLVGTGGSRAATLASGAVMGAAHTLRQRLLQLASDHWEVDPADLELSDGSLAVRGVPSRSLTTEQLAALAPEAIEVEHGYISGEGTWSQSTHCCVVEVDVDTGHVRVVRYLVVEDCGAMVNPAIVEGQVRGGVAQGIGAVLFEKSAYGDDGTFLAGTFMDYLLPTAADLPPIEIVHLESTPDDDVPFRGVGEGGAIGAPAALTNAIEDALVPFGARVREQHLPPYRILELCGRIEG
jgi:carbon-monoxide dehydrogenase large subunit